MSRDAVLLLARHRLSRLFAEMASDLARDHRVIVMAYPEDVAAFSAIPGVEVHKYRTKDIPSARHDLLPLDDAALPEEAAEIEARTGLPLYKADGNFRLYGRIVRSYGGSWDYLPTARDAMQAYVGAYRQLAPIFEQARPKAVFYETIDQISAYMAFALARAQGAFGLEFRFSPLGEGRISPAFGLYRRNIVLEHLFANRRAIEPSSYAQADRILGGLRQSMLGASHARLHRDMAQRSLLRGAWFDVMRVLPLLGDLARWRHAFRNAAWHGRALANRVWLRRHLTARVPEPPYVVFFMQHLPEASTCSEAPQWVDQEMAAEQLAINAPGRYRIVVKEHPRSYGLRGKREFDRLQRLPNVVLAHPSTDNHALLAGADAVVATTGTIGFSGLLLGKRVGVLGRPFYAAYPGVKSLNAPGEIFEAMRDASWAPERMASERRDFLAAYVQSLHEFGVGRGIDAYPASGGGRWAQALRKTLAFIETHGLTPDGFESGLPAPSAPAAARAGAAS